MTETTKECKTSRNGWPLGKFDHRLGDFYTKYAPELIAALSRKFGPREWLAVPYVNDDRFCAIRVNDRLSMEAFGNLRNFIEGYKACLGS